MLRSLALSETRTFAADATWRLEFLALQVVGKAKGAMYTPTDSQPGERGCMGIRSRCPSVTTVPSTHGRSATVLGVSTSTQPTLTGCQPCIENAAVNRPAQEATCRSVAHRPAKAFAFHALYERVVFIFQRDNACITNSLWPPTCSPSVFMVGAGVNSVMTVAVYDKSLRLSRASLEGPRLGQALNYQVTSGAVTRVLLLSADAL